MSSSVLQVPSLRFLGHVVLLCLACAFAWSSGVALKGFGRLASDEPAQVLAVQPTGVPLPSVGEIGLFAQSALLVNGQVRPFSRWETPVLLPQSSLNLALALPDGMLSVEHLSPVGKVRDLVRIATQSQVPVVWPLDLGGLELGTHRLTLRFMGGNQMQQNLSFSFVVR